MSPTPYFSNFLTFDNLFITNSCEKPPLRSTMKFHRHCRAFPEITSLVFDGFTVYSWVCRLQYLHTYTSFFRQLALQHHLRRKICMKPVVYIHFPEAPLAFIGESPAYYAVNLCCLDAPLSHIPPGQLPQSAQSVRDLHEALIVLRLRQEA